MTLLQANTIYIVGIKGVALTSLVQCLLDAGKTVSGSDVAENFVTQPILDRLGVSIDIGFDHPIPPTTECVVYTAAHNGSHNPQVQAARVAGILTLSHAEALGEFFNEKQGIAVCGVGGKSTVSAMVAHMLEHLGEHPSYAVGVGNIPSLDKTGQWSAESRSFVAEADEYVTDPLDAREGTHFVPRFAYLKPEITVCTNLRFDHPDVYRHFEHTKDVFRQFFSQIKPGGTLCFNGDDQPLSEFVATIDRSDIRTLSFGENPNADIRLLEYTSATGTTTAQLTIAGNKHTVSLSLPGKYNVMNALAALTALHCLGLPLQKAADTLASFRSTLRRFEDKGIRGGVHYYDDYAHHPNEVKQAIQALTEWYPNARKVIAFQSHTFSRTRELFPEFVASFADADEVVMIDIFASAREAFDTSITSTQLCEEIMRTFPGVTAHNVHTIENLAHYCQENLRPGDVCLTLGAGDIYKMYEQLP